MDSVLITGGTGSAGSALARHYVESTNARRVIVFSRDEYKQHQLQQTLTSDRVRWFVGDVRSVDRLRLAFRGVETVIHCAAMKQVPACEYNPQECVATNVEGAVNVMRAALDCGVSRVLALSTDKAVAPTTLYGNSKATMERVLLAANAHAGTAFSIVRYGNVAGSRGSVIPLWKQQHAQGRPLTLTAPDCTRFHLTIPQAVTFIAENVETMTGGELFVPRMPSVRLSELAAVIGGPVQVTGLRGTEKKHETVIAAHERVEGLPSPYTSDGNTEWLEGDALRQAVATI